jgi:hypothetical protein
MAVTAQVNVKIDSTQASKSVGELNSQINKATGSFSSMKAELRSITQELQGLQAGTARFQELSQRAGVLRDTIADTGAVISATAGNAVENFGRALGNSVQLGVAGFQALSSAQVLFGVENEDLQRSLAQMGALLNLTQAIETFGGLGDKLVEIKAGFTPVLQSLGLMATTQTEVAIATGAADAALVGEAVAADGAAVSTGFFATALNALPLVAIVTALGLLVAGLISYASASGDAEKNEKKRTASLKAQREEEKKATETIAQESAEYVGLIYQLKSTNAGSKERETLINQINATYGTTLKNLSDEKAFQQSLNLEVANYITYQKAKFQLQKNDELVQKNLIKQDEINKKINETLNKRRFYDNEIIRLGKLTDPQGIQQMRDKQDEYNQVIKKYQDELAAAEKRMLSYGKVNNDVNSVINEVTNNGKKYGDQTKKNTTATNDNTDALERQKDALSNLRSLYDRQVEAEKQLEAIQKSRIEQQMSTTSFVEDEYGNLVKVQESFVDYNEKFNLEIFNIQQGYRDKQSNLIDQATEREIQKYEESILGKKVSETDYYNARKKIAENGVKNLLESEILLFAEFTNLSEKEVEEYTRAWTLKEQIAQESTILTQTQIEKLTLEFNRDQRINDVENSKLTEEEKAKEIISIRKEFLDNTTKLLERERDIQIKVLEKQRDLELTNLDLTENEKLLITQKYNKQILEVNQNTQKAIQDETAATVEVQKTQLETLEEQLASVDDYLAALQSLFSDFESAVTNVTEQNNERRTQAIQDSVNAQTQILDANLQSRLITQQEYDNQLLQLQQQQEQEERNLAKKAFQTNKKLNLVGATIDGARAVLSTFANTPGELIIKSIAAALAGVFAATQVAVIARSTFTAADGGIVPGTNSGDIDSVSARLAPGEAVINSRSTNKFLPVLSAINQDGGGRSLMPNLPATNQGQTFEVVFPENKQTQPVRAYVVESDISDAQKRVQRIENSTRF